MNVLKIFLAVAAISFVPSLCAQANCSFIQNFLNSDTKNVGTSCDVHFNQTVTETQTYDVQCVDGTHGNSVYFETTSQMTSTGTSSLSCSGSSKLDCSPTFQAENVNAGFTSPTDNINRFFLRVWPRQQDVSGCVQLSMSQDLKQCAAVQCPGGGGNSGNCTPNPNKLEVGPVGDLVQQDPGDPPPPCTVSPILVDLSGQGFHLTDVDSGVRFDILSDGKPIQMAWTAPGADNAFLALPGADGRVYSSNQLFGNYTPQPKSAHPNGFLALAVYDEPANGGNGDGVIDARDQIFSSLRLWIDENHDGICQPEELYRLPDKGIYSISLEYRQSQRTDEFGNVFRYKARINQGVHQEDDPAGRAAFDVFFVTR